MKMRLVLGVVLSTAVVLSCSDSTRVAMSGVEGRVTRSPICPVETSPPTPGCEPAALVATLEIRNQAGDLVKRVTSDGDGLYRVALDPGQYSLHPLHVSPPPSFPIPPPAIDLTVPALAWTQIDVDYDTGIR